MIQTKLKQNWPSFFKLIKNQKVFWHHHNQNCFFLTNHIKNVCFINKLTFKILFKKKWYLKLLYRKITFKNVVFWQNSINYFLTKPHLKIFSDKIRFKNVFSTKSHLPVKFFQYLSGKSWQTVNAMKARIREETSGVGVGQ
jgi:hypothetical protein